VLTSEAEILLWENHNRLFQPTLL